ncbi:hypothetical protein AMTR_s00023p00187640 [Amborella trichopoda]|uniref:Uncharacterized protein n=1 Tax=Amborella trichopoda TaxID=13333 RepID=W1NJH7_AMBTC|nr:hypothetical protein AMTR_s00023p00187640 [Amborella trichopoda]
MHPLPFHLATVKGQAFRSINRFDPLDIDPLALVVLDPMDELDAHVQEVEIAIGKVAEVIDIVEDLPLGEDTLEDHDNEEAFESNFAAVEMDVESPLFVLPQPKQSPPLLDVVGEVHDMAKVGTIIEYMGMDSDVPLGVICDDIKAKKKARLDSISGSAPAVSSMKTPMKKVKKAKN